MIVGYFSALLLYFSLLVPLLLLAVFPHFVAVGVYSRSSSLPFLVARSSRIIIIMSPSLLWFYQHFAFLRFDVCEPALRRVSRLLLEEQASLLGLAARQGERERSATNCELRIVTDEREKSSGDPICDQI